MTKYFLTLALIVSTLCAVAQSHQIARIGLVKDGNNYSLSYPSTTISVELLVETETVTPGIYARYAQKYLSNRAPLVAQTTHRVVDAVINIVDDEMTSSITPQPMIDKQVKLPVDQYSSVVLADDDAARDAASAIFTIRRQRREIINGEAGEGYFGAGLEDAMRRLDQMESEYLELFMGSHVVTQSVKRYTFSPQEGASRHVVARFDAKQGALPATDLTGVPIYLQFIPQTMPDTSSIEMQAKSKGTPMWFRVAAPTQCLLYVDSQFITSSTVSIFELGKSVAIEVLN
ncbi:MAG: DUF4831 family protein [Rikenellaceae bacterium]